MAATAATRRTPAADAHRDPRLDFFRGVGMFIILIAHTPLNSWTKWIPARFGYSDATEIFVFCSGAASAIAFMSVYKNRGWSLGTARVGYRLWQVYWSHIGLFLATAVALIMVDNLLETGGFYLASLGLPPFERHGDDQILALMTLTYVPNLFDILPMYLVILALMPIVAALALESRTAALVFVATLYLAGSQPWIVFDAAWLSETLAEQQALFQYTLTIAVALAAAGVALVIARGARLGRRGWLFAIVVAGAVAAAAPILWEDAAFFAGLTNLDLPARPWDDSNWFFNPFAWQLVFFTGFAFATGWIPAPPIRRWLMILCAVILVVCIPLDPDGALPREFARYIRELRADGADPALIARLAEIRDVFREVRADLGALSSKTYFGLFRFIHFLALAYLVWALAGDRGANLPKTGVGGRIVTIVRRVGQQSLAVFVASIVIARLLHVWIRETAEGPAARVGVEDAFRRAAIETDIWAILAANLVGFALIIAVAYVARYFRRQPWREKKA